MRIDGDPSNSLARRWLAHTPRCPAWSPSRAKWQRKASRICGKGLGRFTCGLKIVKNRGCYSVKNGSFCLRLFDSLPLSRHGESSVELSSVMILDPMFGNSLAKAAVDTGQ